jgi:hypothetical protein
MHIEYTNPQGTLISRSSDVILPLILHHYPLLYIYSYSLRDNGNIPYKDWSVLARESTDFSLKQTKPINYLSEAVRSTF